MAISAGDAVIELGLDTKKLDSGLKGVSGRLDQASQKWGRKMKMAGGIMIGAVAAVGGASLKMAADFDSAMREVNTMMLLSEEEFTGFSEEVRGLAKDMGVDAVEAANALYQAISAGIPKENAVEFLAIASKAAIGGVTDTMTAVDGLTTVLNAFKIPVSEAERVADLMFTTVKGGKTTFEELSASMFNVAPIAAAAGVKFETVSAALATMTKQGVPTSVATTQLRQAIQAMIKPTADMKTALDTLGYASGDALIAERGLAGALDLLTEASGGSNEVLGKMFGSVEGLQAVLALTGENAKIFTADMAAMADAEGAAADAAAEMEKTTGKQMQNLKVAMQDIGITIGTAIMPALIKLLEIITPIIEKVATWIEKNPKLAAGMLAAVGALGGLLLAGGFLLPMISSLITILPVLGGALTAMLGPIGLIVLAIAAVIAIGVLVYKNWDTIKEKAGELWDGIKMIFTNIKDFFVNVWGNITNIFKEHWLKILTILFPAIGLPILIAKNWGKITEAVKGIWNRVKEVFSGIWETAKEWGLNLVKGLWEGIKSMKSWIWDKVTGFAAGIFDSVKEGMGKLWPFSPSEAGVDIGEGLTAGIGVGVKKTLQDVRSAMRDVTGAISIDSGLAGPGTTETTTVANNFNINELVVREEADIQKIARELYRLQRSKGVLVGA